MPLSTLQPSLVPATWLSPASPLSPPASTRAGAVVPGRWRRGWAGALALAASFAMVPWTAGLAARLPHRYVAHHWNATWVGFDTLLLLSFAVTGWTAWRHSQAATAATAVTITMLGCDAWFDLTTASTRADLVTSAVTAVAGELPLAAVLGYLVRRTVREPSPRWPRRPTVCVRRRVRQRDVDWTGRLPGMMLGFLAALVSAVCYGVASVLQASAARTAPSSAGVDPRLLLRLSRRLPFVGGMLLDLGGFLAQFVALRFAPVFLVQAAQAASLAVTAVVAAPVLRVRLRGVEWAAIAAVTVGLGALGLSAGAEGAAHTSTGFRFALVAAAVVLAAAGFGAGRVAEPARSAVLGLVAGLGFGVVALAARTLTGLTPAHLVRDPGTYALALGGVAAFLFYATGLQRGAVTVVTAAVIVGETVLPAAIGVLVFGDHARVGMVPVGVGGFVVALAGAFGLARFGELPAPGRNGRQLIS